MRTTILIYLLSLLSSCAFLFKSSVITPVDPSSEVLLVGDDACLGGAKLSAGGNIVILPQPSGHMRLIGPLFIPIFPISVNWKDEIEALYFYVFLSDFEDEASASKAVTEVLKADNWQVRIGQFKVHASNIQPFLDEEKNQNYLRVKFEFPKQKVQTYTLVYKPEKLELAFHHRLDWVYRAFTIDPKLAPQCTKP